MSATTETERQAARRAAWTEVYGPPNGSFARPGPSQRDNPAMTPLASVADGRWRERAVSNGGNPWVGAVR
jgi:hypothetical protein